MPDAIPDTVLPESRAALSPELSSSGRPRTKLPPEALTAALAAAGAAPAAPETSVKPPEPPAKVEPTTPPAAAAPTPKPAAVPETAPEPAPKKRSGVEELREAYERANAKLKEVEATATATNREKAEAYAKVAKLEEDYSKANKRITEELEPLTKRYAEVEKRLQQREEALRVRDYQATDEWHTKYERPLAEARADAEAFVSEFEVQEANGTARRANAKELDAVLSAPSASQSLAVAKQIFGDDVAPLVLNHRMKIQSLARARGEALQRSQLESLEYQKRFQANQAQQRQSFHSALLAEAESLVASSRPGADDPELAGVFSEGLKFADDILMGDPSSLPPQQLIKTLAEHRARSIKAPVLEKRLARLETENQSLKARLSEFERSEPSVTPRNGGTHVESSDPKQAMRDGLLEKAMKMAARP